MSPQLIIAALIAAAGFGTAWKIQDWRMDAKEKEHVEQQLESERRAAKTAIRRVETVIEAQNAAQARERDLRSAAAAARVTADGLRTSVATALSAAANDHAACTLRANALGELFITVEEAGRGMAEKADLHASDARKMMEAWPK